MSVIDELAAKLKSAKNAEKRAQRKCDDDSAVAAESRNDLKRCQARVAELEQAISLLRNGLKTKTTEVSGGNVTTLKPR